MKLSPIVCLIMWFFSAFQPAAIPVYEAVAVQTEPSLTEKSVQVDPPPSPPRTSVSTQINPPPLPLRHAASVQVDTAALNRCRSAAIQVDLPPPAPRSSISVQTTSFIPPILTPVNAPEPSLAPLHHPKPRYPLTLSPPGLRSHEKSPHSTSLGRKYIKSELREVGLDASAQVSASFQMIIHRLIFKGGARTQPLAYGG
jgi:hypothetical protein